MAKGFPRSSIRGGSASRSVRGSAFGRRYGTRSCLVGTSDDDDSAQKRDVAIPDGAAFVEVLTPIAWRLLRIAVRTSCGRAAPGSGTGGGAASARALRAETLMSGGASAPDAPQDRGPRQARIAAQGLPDAASATREAVTCAYWLAFDAGSWIQRVDQERRRQGRKARYGARSDPRTGGRIALYSGSSRAFLTLAGLHSMSTAASRREDLHHDPSMRSLFPVQDASGAGSARRPHRALRQTSPTLAGEILPRTVFASASRPRAAASKPPWRVISTRASPTATDRGRELDVSACL